VPLRSTARGHIGGDSTIASRPSGAGTVGGVKGQSVEGSVKGKGKGRGSQQLCIRSRGGLQDCGRRDLNGSEMGVEGGG